MADSNTRDVGMAGTEDQFNAEINGEKDDSLRIKTVGSRNQGFFYFISMANKAVSTASRSRTRMRVVRDLGRRSYSRKFPTLYDHEEVCRHHSTYASSDGFACSPKVELCGYSIPHPSENHLNLRIQIYRKYPPR